MAAFLFFQLAGPMASWGGIAVGEDRGSAPHPSRSAVLGILASALGIRRREEDRLRTLAQACRVAVVVVDPGSFLRDYHTTQVPSCTDAKGWPLRTRRDELDLVAWLRPNKGKAGEAILSSRDYRCDGQWIIGIQAASSDPVFSLDAFRRALLEPQLCLFLGRKACSPSLPLAPQIIEAETLVDGLGRIRFGKIGEVAASRRLGTGPRSIGLYWEPGMDVGFEPRETVERRDDPLSRQRWQFRPRLEHHAPLPEGVMPC
jgi:CRISPR system Cascade subunit CasD